MSLKIDEFTTLGSPHNLLERDVKDITYIGIDFGTSTTVIHYSFINENNEIETKPIPIRQEYQDGRTTEHELIPSVIAWHKNKLLIGVGARELKSQLIKNRNLWYSFKMELGVNIGKVYYNSLLNGENKCETIYTPQDATTVFFNYLKGEIDRYINENKLSNNIQYSISIPASFELNQRRDLIECLLNAGIVTTQAEVVEIEDCRQIG